MRAVDPTDVDGHWTYNNTEAHVYWFDSGVVIETEPTGTGSWNAERVLPWSRVFEYRKEPYRGD